MFGDEKMKIRTKHKIKEILVFSSIIFILGIIIYFNSNYFNGLLGRLFFPKKNTVFEYSKVYFTSVSIVMFVEYFLVVQLPNNFFLSRSFSLLVMMIISILGFALFIFLKLTINRTFFLIFLFCLSIILGQLLSYFIQTRQTVRNGKYIALFIYILMIIFLVIFTLFDSFSLLNYFV